MVASQLVGLHFYYGLLGVLVAWVITNIKSGSLQEIPDSVAAIIGILMTGKVAQKFDAISIAPCFAIELNYYRLKSAGSILAEAN